MLKSRSRRRTLLPERLEDRRLLSATFASPISLTTAGISSVATATDFNGDGQNDIVAVNASSNSISFFRATGSTTFAAATTLTTAALPGDAIIADYNGDGFLDIGVTQAQAGSVGIFRGNGDGTFAARLDFGYGGASLTTNVDRMVAGDFNNDSLTDVVVGNRAAGTLVTLMGTSGGLVALHTKSVFQPAGIVTADFNGDGVRDLAVLSGSTTTLQLFPGQGNGQFADPFAEEFAPASDSAGGGLVLRDFNNDGILDLAATSHSAAGDKINVLRSNGDGSFRDVESTNLPTGAGAIIAGDFDQDARSDVLVNFSNGTSDILLGNSDASFQPALGLALATGTWIKAVASNFGTDLKVDLAIPTGAGSASLGTVNVFRNTTGEIVKAVTTTTITSSLNPANYGDSVTLTATVTSPGGVPTGRVTFFRGSTRVARVTLDGAGVATYTSAAFLPGNVNITARYTGASEFETSEATLTQTIVTTPTSITGTISRISLPSIIVPGDRGSIRVRMLNQGGTRGTGAVQVKLFASTDGTISEDDVALGTSLDGTNVNLGAGRAITKSGSVIVPSNLTPGAYNILAMLVAGEGLDPSTVVGDRVHVATTTVEWSFGAVGERNNVKLVRTLDDGTTATFSLSRAGKGTLSTDSSTVSITDAAINSTFAVKLKGPATAIGLSTIMVNSSIGTINAPNVNLSGALAIAGSTKSIKLGNLTGGSIAVAGSEKRVALTLGSVSESLINSLAPFSSVKVQSWDDNDETSDVITAPWIDEIRSNAGFPVDLTLSGSGAPRGEALGSFRAISIGNAAWSIAGGVDSVRLDGNIDGIFTADVNGDFDSLRVGGSVVDFSMSVSGAMSTLRVDGNFVGDVGAASFRTIDLRGSVNNSRVLAGADFGADARIDGVNDTYGVGTIRTLSVGGGMGSSIFAAGLNPVNGVFLDGDDQLIPGGRIRTVRVGALEDSKILAAELPPSVQVDGLSLDSSSDVQFRL